MLYVRANFNRVKSHVMLYVKESVLWSFEKKMLDLGDNCCITVSKVLQLHLQLYVEESALFVLFRKSFGFLCETECVMIT